MNHPQYSIIIPTWNRPKRLVKCLQGFTNLDYPAGAWELIVVNDGGTESFVAITENLKQLLPLQFVEKDHAGPAAARNAGAKLARGNYLAFTDDDCLVESHWLHHFNEGFADGTWHALGGRTLNPFPDNEAAGAWQHLIDFLYYYMRDEADNALWLMSNNVAYRREVFESLGGFNETFPLAASEDLELSSRLLATGYRQRYCSDALVWHYHRATWWGYINQQFRYGRGGYFLQQALKRIKNIQQIKPSSPTPFYTALGESLSRVNAPPSMWLLQGISQMAYHVGKVYQLVASCKKPASLDIIF